jgi:hypothetical protein
MIKDLTDDELRGRIQLCERVIRKCRAALEEMDELERTDPPQLPDGVAFYRAMCREGLHVRMHTLSLRRLWYVAEAEKRRGAEIEVEAWPDCIMISRPRIQQ